MTSKTSSMRKIPGVFAKAWICAAGIVASKALMMLNWRATAKLPTAAWAAAAGWGRVKMAMTLNLSPGAAWSICCCRESEIPSPSWSARTSGTPPDGASPGWPGGVGGCWGGSMGTAEVASDKAIARTTTMSPNRRMVSSFPARSTYWRSPATQPDAQERTRIQTR